MPAASAHLRHDQLALFRAVADRCGLEIAHLSLADDSRGGTELSDHFPRAKPVTDFRHELTSANVQVVLLGALPGAKGEEAGAIADLCAQRGLRLITLEPIPASATDVRRAELWGTAVRIVPLLRDATLFAAAGEALADFGPIRTVSIASRAARADGSLGARLFDAMLIVHSLLGQPESIDASVICPGSVAGVHPAPADSLALLSGDLTANLRFAGPHAASMSLSDRAGRWFRGVTLLGDAGCIRIDDAGFEVIDPAGTTIDRSPGPSGARAKGADPTGEKKSSRRKAEPGGAAPAEKNSGGTGAIDVLAAAVARALDDRSPRPAPIDFSAVLSMCEAAILSARTGQAESPATVQRMAMAS
ncbi:MAG TPA: hypothetical protein VG797_04295 [Phycisphaerales bacterium]|nr:hypothetical protein [Phycisphaerales bacterium]